MIPGTRVTITGVYTIMEKNNISSTGQAGGLKTPYIICLGYETEQSGSSRIMPNFSNAEKERFNNYSKDPLIYEKISKSIATSIFGSPDIK
jgi:DNA replication licensing factor MCM5